ncbi:MAG: DUF4236 domain-containing protein [Clostridium sp.]|uniref:DUF4236 domain-containing protein n=1 Tax=Clostridium sp. TaxID=1506 RepID=UPI00303D2290
MGFRFRKSKNFGPFRVNLSKSGIGWSVGGKGFRYTKRADGKTQTTASIPGTGISYVDVKGSNKKVNPSSTSNDNFPNNNNNHNNKPPFYKSQWFLWVMLFLFPPVGLCMLYFHKDYSKKKRTILSGVFAVYMLLFYIPAMATPNESNNLASKSSTQQKQLNNEKTKDDEAAKLATEKKAKEDEQTKLVAAQKAKDEEQAKLAAEKKAKEDEQAKLAAEQKVKDEESARLAAEQKAKADADAANKLATENVTKVYIAGSGNGTKYHNNSNCSNMTSPVKINLSDAQKSYGPCKKCY